MSLFVILGSAAGPPPSGLFHYLGSSTLSFSRVVFTLTPFPPSLRIRGWISEFPRACSRRPRPPAHRALFSQVCRGREEIESECVRKEGRKGINISESRSLRRKFEPRRRTTDGRDIRSSLPFHHLKESSGEGKEGQGRSGKEEKGPRSR